MDIKKPQLVKVEAFAYFFVGSSATPSWRSQPDSNWCKRFCRPVPNHSDMRPFARDFPLFCDAKLAVFLFVAKYICNYFLPAGNLYYPV